MLVVVAAGGGGAGVVAVKVTVPGVWKLVFPLPVCVHKVTKRV